MKAYHSSYTDFSIGFLTRGCFRKCPFCVNRNESKVFKYSELSDFLDSDRKVISLLDDNFLGYAGWEDAPYRVASNWETVSVQTGS